MFCTDHTLELASHFRTEFFTDVKTGAWLPGAGFSKTPLIIKL